MDSPAADLADPGPGASFAGGLAKIAEGLDDIFASGVTPANGDSARILIQAFESQARRIDAVAVKLLDAVDQSGTHRLDGHRSAKVMCRHLGRLSEPEATRRQQAAKALKHMPKLKAAFEAGLVSADQVAVLARAFANPRICSKVVEMDAVLTDKALDASVDYRDFDRHVRSWADRVDEDGTIDRFQRSHRNRDARFDQDFDTSWHLSGGCAANDGVEFKQLFDRFVDEQFELDWKEAKARLERDDIAISDLARTPSPAPLGRPHGNGPPRRRHPARHQRLPGRHQHHHGPRHLRTVDRRPRPQRCRGRCGCTRRALRIHTQRT